MKKQNETIKTKTKKEQPPQIKTETTPTSKKKTKKEREKKNNNPKSCENYIATRQTNQVTRSGDINACVTFIQE